MTFLRRHRLLLSMLLGFGTFVGLAWLTGSLLGPVTCRDGWASPSIGSRGAYSWHGGVDRSRDMLLWLYAAASGGLGYWIHNSLDPAPPRARPDPLVYARCPKCRSKMHRDRECPALLRCNRHPLCGGTADLEPRPAPQVQPRPAPVIEPPVIPAPPGEAACPACGARMILRKAKRGRRYGQHFFGCSRYPRCTGTRGIKR